MFSTFRELNPSRIDGRVKIRVTRTWPSIAINGNFMGFNLIILDEELFLIKNRLNSILQYLIVYFNYENCTLSSYLYIFLFSRTIICRYLFSPNNGILYRTSYNKEICMSLRILLLENLLGGSDSSPLICRSDSLEQQLLKLYHFMLLLYQCTNLSSLILKIFTILRNLTHGRRILSTLHVNYLKIHFVIVCKYFSMI